MKTYAVYMKMKGPVRRQIGSDTLFGAFCWAIRAIHSADALILILKEFNEGPKFVLSSAFPFLFSGDRKVRFYPKPLIAEAKLDYMSSASLDLIEKAKNMKSAQFVSEEIFFEMISGSLTSDTILERLQLRGAKDKDIERVEDALVTTRERRMTAAAVGKHVWLKSDVQHNEVDRVLGSTVEGRLFFDEETLFSRESSGLWFMVRTDDLDYIKGVLRFISDTGVGGDRSSGKGQVAIDLRQVEEISLPEPQDPNCFVSLSRYVPSMNEVDFSELPLSYTLNAFRPKYESLLETGFLHKGIIRMFEPGSIFPFAQQKPFFGRLVPVFQNEGGVEYFHNGTIIPVLAKLGGHV